MKDLSHAADRIVGEALAPFFPRELPPYLGQEIFLSIRRRLRTAGRYLDDEHANEVFQCVIVEAYSYLAQHGGDKIRHVREWLHRISLNATRSYLAERYRFDLSITSSLNVAIDREIEVADVSNEILLEQVQSAIRNLRPRYQEVILLSLVEGLPVREIQERMKIASSAYFRKLKCEAIIALRKELLRFFRPGLLEQDTDRSKPTLHDEHLAPAGTRENGWPLPHRRGHH